MGVCEYGSVGVWGWATITDYEEEELRIVDF